MPTLPRVRRDMICLAVIAIAGIVPPSRAAAPRNASLTGKVNFNRDIRPILSANCYTCHGPDAAKRQAELRLDLRDSAVRAAIMPGKAANSPLVARITSADPDERMPPAEAKKPPLAPEAVELIRRWIDEGAAFDVHWSYAPLVRPAVPPSKDVAWPRGAIDHFIAAEHARQGLHPAADADPRTLVRRVSLDLTGLPPTLEQADAFAADHSPAAYERLVDRLLAAPQFGERMALYWLDVVRYADTCGYHSDNERPLWRYRDYVIQAFNSNKRFDRFTVEQIAGDLLPEVTSETRIASGYNRLLQTTEEGGAQAKEYTAKYAADRVRNVAAGWLGATMVCAQCHDHKYDPYTTRDFYSMAAFFADVQENAIKRQDPTPIGSPEQVARLRKFDEQIAAAETEISRAAAVSPEVLAALRIAPDKQKAKQREAVAAHYAEAVPRLKPLVDKLADLKQKKTALEQSVPVTLVTTSVTPREVRILPRGNWQDDSGEVVTPAIPQFLGTLDVKGRRATRLDLAQWLVSRQNPLTARVMVNRLWKLFFGQGLVRTVEDLGTQGAAPSHPELLDWLATELVESGWDLKHTIRLMVVSRTYQQSSRGTAELDRRDPTNQWLARQGRFRLEAETIRDGALAASGLLAPTVGGPSVKPYQPAGYWDFLNFPKRQWQNDRGEGQYRRGLYTFWQRTFLHPSLLAFDASTREECCVDRARSNTPLQALVLLDDPTYVEAARVFAARVIRDGGPTEASRLQYAFRHVLLRDPAPAERDVLARLAAKHLAQYQADSAAATALLKVGDAPLPDGVKPAELAAWTSVTRVLLNLHETVTRD